MVRLDWSSFGETEAVIRRLRETAIPSFEEWIPDPERLYALYAISPLGLIASQLTYCLSLNLNWHPIQIKFLYSSRQLERQISNRGRDAHRCSSRMENTALHSGHAWG